MDIQKSIFNPATQTAEECLGEGGISLTRKSLQQWLDIAFPISLTLLCLDEKIASYALLSAWIACRLWLNGHRERLNWILLGLLLVNAGTIVTDRDLQPSSPSDFLIVALAFAAGLNRTSAQWKSSLQWISLCSLPLLIYAIGHPSGEVLKLPHFNVNRLAFLLGILMIAGWSLARGGSTKAMRLGGISIASAGVPLAILTHSRAALAAPSLAILLSYAIQALSARTPRQHINSSGRAILAIASILLITIAAAYNWYGRGSVSREDINSDAMRFPTALCWANQAFKRPSNFFLGAGYNEKVRSHCDGNDIPILMQVPSPRPEGLPHSHNLFAQILGETGVPGFATAIAVAAWATRRLWRKLRHKAVSRAQYLIDTYLLAFCIYLALNALFTSFHLFLMTNQVLIGYSIAAFSVLPETNEAASPV